MKTKTKSKVAAFLEEHASRKSRCAVCDHKESSAALDEIIAARRAGTSRVSIPEAHAFLKATYDVQYGSSLIHLCVRGHRGGTWGSHRG